MTELKTLNRKLFILNFFDLDMGDMKDITDEELK